MTYPSKRVLAYQQIRMECLEPRILLTSGVMNGNHPRLLANWGPSQVLAAMVAPPGNGIADSTQNVKIASGTPNGPTLADDDGFGGSVAALGDLDGDGVTDLAVGARGDDTGGFFCGAVHVLFMNANGTVKNTVTIASETNGGPRLVDGDVFGFSVAALGDLDSDGVTDLAVGATGDDDGESELGAVHVLFLNANGTVKSSTKITQELNGGPALSNLDQFGFSLAPLSDLDGDGVTDLAVGAIGDDTAGIDRGAVYVLFLNANGTVKSTITLTSGTNGCPTLADGDLFGFSLASLGDLNSDGVTDLAVGAIGDDSGGAGRGAVHVLFMNANGTVKDSLKLASDTHGGPTLADDDSFGTSLASLGDLNGDGVIDLAVGAIGDDTGGTDRGAVHLLLLKSDGTVKSSLKLASNTNGGPTLADHDWFGSSVASLSDLDGDGVTDLAVGAENDGTGGSGRGALHILSLTDVDEAPQLNLGTHPVIWTKKLSPIVVLPQITVGGTANLTGGTLTISIDTVSTAKKPLDQVRIPPFDELGSSPGHEFVNGRFTLQIQLGPNATNAAIQAFLRGIKFATKGQGLKVLTRTLNVTLSTGGQSSAVSQTINIRKKA